MGRVEGARQNLLLMMLTVMINEYYNHIYVSYR